MIQRKAAKRAAKRVVKKTQYTKKRRKRNRKAQKDPADRHTTTKWNNNEINQDVKITRERSRAEEPTTTTT